MPAEFRTRKPTGKPPYPTILLSGAEKCGKSYAAAAFSGSELVGRTFWISLGETDVDQYGAVPGARYEIVEHDSTYADVARAVRQAAAQPRVDGRPNAIVIDSMTKLWELLSDEQQQIANSRQRQRNSNGEATITMDQWNAAKRRWQHVVDTCVHHDGPVILTARLENVTVVNAAGNPTSTKEWKVRAEKNLPYDVDVVVKMFAPEDALLTGVRSLVLRVPQDGLKIDDFSLDSLLRSLGLGEPDATAPRSYTAPIPDAAEAAADAERATEPPKADQRQLTALNTLLGKKLGLVGDARFPALSSKLQRTITSTAQIYAPEARNLISALSDMPDRVAPAVDPDKPPEDASQLAYDLSLAIGESTTMGELQSCALGIKASRDQGKLTDPEREWLLAVFDRQQARVVQDQAADQTVGAAS